MHPQKRPADDTSDSSNKKPRTEDAPRTTLDDDQDEIDYGKLLLEQGADALPMWQQLMNSNFPIIQAQAHALIAQTPGDLSIPNRVHHATESLTIYRQLAAADPTNFFVLGAITTVQVVLAGLGVDDGSVQNQDDADRKKKEKELAAAKKAEEKKAARENAAKEFAEGGKERKRRNDIARLAVERAQIKRLEAEKAARDKAARAQKARDEAAKEKVARAEATRAKEARAKEARERDAREKKAREEAAKDGKKDSAQIEFQFMSDLHFERTASANAYNMVIPPEAKYLILAGDIRSLTLPGHSARYQAFLSRHTKTFKRIFLILGNNEFKQGGMTLAAGLAIARTFPLNPAMRGKLTLLEQDRYDLTDENGARISILGCALWSRVDANRLSRRNSENIFQNTRITHNDRFEVAHAWLKREVGKIRNEKDCMTRRILVITHHAPVIRGCSDPAHGRGNNSMFCSDILGGTTLNISGLGSGDVWVFGHTHWNTDFLVDGVRVIANQRGAFLERAGSGFSVNKTFKM